MRHTLSIFFTDIHWLIFYLSSYCLLYEQDLDQYTTITILPYVMISNINSNIDLTLSLQHAHRELGRLPIARRQDYKKLDSELQTYALITIYDFY